MAAPSTEIRFSFERMAVQAGSVLGFVSDVATLAASSENASYPVENVQAFTDLSLGSFWRTTTTTTVTLDFDLGSAQSINWCHLAGLRGIVDAADFSATTGVELLSGASAPAATSQGFFEACPTTGDLWITLDAPVSAQHWRIAFNSVDDGTALGFYEVKRAALGNFSTMGTNYLTGFSQNFQDRSKILTNNFGDEVVRYRRSRSILNFRFSFVGKDATDIGLWRQFVSWNTESQKHLAPQVPWYMAPDPTGGTTGPNGDWFAPRFVYLTQIPRLVRMRPTADNFFDIQLQVTEISK